MKPSTGKLTEIGFYYFHVVIHILKQIFHAWMIITIALHRQLSAVNAQLKQLHMQARHTVSSYCWIALGIEEQETMCVMLRGIDVPWCNFLKIQVCNSLMVVFHVNFFFCPEMLLVGWSWNLTSQIAKSFFSPINYKGFLFTAHVNLQFLL